MSLFYFSRRAFTLVELSIVLVIMGLMAGGVLAGQSMIHTAQMRGQIVQIDQLRVVVTTFQGRHRYLPGDLPEPTATQMGLSTRQAGSPDGNGNGLIEAWSSSAQGETSLFWNDLSNSGLIPNDYLYITGGPAGMGPGYNLAVQTNVGRYLPEAKLGGGLYVYVWSGGPNPTINSGIGTDGHNYFTVATVRHVSGAAAGPFQSFPEIAVADAYNIDAKIDNGMPQSGAVRAFYLTTDAVTTNGTWAGMPGISGENHKPNTIATPASSTSCYDNGGGAGEHYYSMTYNDGDEKNCALSFKL